MERIVKVVTARDLKNQTGKVLKLVESGQKVLITKRSKPFAVLSPINEEELETAGLRNYEEAWRDLEETLRTTRPEFKSVNEAMKWTRKRR